MENRTVAKKLIEGETTDETLVFQDVAKRMSLSPEESKNSGVWPHQSATYGIHFYVKPIRLSEFDKLVEDGWKKVHNSIFTRGPWSLILKSVNPLGYSHFGVRPNGPNQDLKPDALIVAVEVAFGLSPDTIRTITRRGFAQKGI